MDSKTKSLLQNTAIEMFKQYGYDNVSVNQLCKACSVSKTTFYFHFQSKRDIIINFYYKAHKDAEEYLLGILEGETTVEQLWNLVSPYVKLSFDAGVSVTREVLKEFLFDKKAAILPDNVYLKKAMIQLLERAQKTGEIQNMSEINTLSDVMIHTFNGVTFSWVMSDGAFDLLDKAERAFSCLLMPKHKIT
ncbi:MAG: TetR/AcrR family transcriptional regulator [Treponema sp.]|nr:TetR/AcrR family transcriptional regulator [Treponema sp.]